MHENSQEEPETERTRERDGPVRSVDSPSLGKGPMRWRFSFSLLMRKLGLKG